MSGSASTPPPILVNYRIADTLDVADRLAAELRARFGRERLTGYEFLYQPRRRYGLGKAAAFP